MQILDRLLGSLRRCCQTLPDRRRGKNTQYAMADFGLAAFAVFFMQSPSFLAHQRRPASGQGGSNGETLLGMGKIPCDGQVRMMLDPASRGSSSRCSPLSWANWSDPAGSTACAICAAAGTAPGTAVC